MDNGYGYIRLSGRDEREQVAPGVQKDAIEKLSSEHGVNLILFDESKTGLHSARKRTNMPEWAKLRAQAMSDPRARYVFFYDLSRGWRNSEAFQHDVKEFHKKGIKVVFSVEGEVKFESADSQLIWGFRSSIAEYESAKTTERLKNHYAKRRMNGVYTGQKAPFGLTRKGSSSDGTLRFEPNDDLKVIIAFLNLYVSRPIGINNAARELHKAGYYWRDWHGNKRDIQPYHIVDMLRILETYQPYVPQDLYRRAIRNRTERHWQKSAPRRHPPLLLYSLLRCAKCDTCITQKFITVKEKTYSFYQHSPHSSCPGSLRIAPAHVIDAQVWHKLREHAAYWQAHLDDYAALLARPKEDAPDLAPKRARRDKVMDALASLPRKIAEDLITASEARALRAEYEQELESLRQELADKPIPEQRFKNPAEARAFLGDAIQMLTMLELGAPYAPEEANALMRNLLLKVLWDDRKIVAIQPRPEFTDLLAPFA